MQCDMCGKTSELFVALIEGGELNVCKDCGVHGKVLRKCKAEDNAKKKPVLKKSFEPENETIQLISSDYPIKIRKAREKMGLSQKDFAKKLNEKESIIHKLETGGFEPSIDLARKLERFCSIKLVEEYEVERTPKKDMPSGEGFTIGDMIRFKK